MSTAFSTVDVAAMHQMHQDITAGNAEAPAWYTKQGRNYRKWVKENTREIARVERMASIADGVQPTAHENVFSNPKPRGYTGKWSGEAAVVSGPKEWQTTTNLSGGFNPNVVGAPAPVIGTPWASTSSPVLKSPAIPCRGFAKASSPTPSASYCHCPALVNPL